MNRTKEESERTRQQILEAAFKIFTDFGYEHTSLNQIAAEAGLSRGAIYWHFKNKDDLYHVFLFELYEELKQKRIAIAKSEHDTPKEKILRLLMLPQEEIVKYGHVTFIARQARAFHQFLDLLDTLKSGRQHLQELVYTILEEDEKIRNEWSTTEKTALCNTICYLFEGLWAKGLTEEPLPEERLRAMLDRFWP